MSGAASPVTEESTVEVAAAMCGVCDLRTVDLDMDVHLPVLRGGQPTCARVTIPICLVCFDGFTGFSDLPYVCPCGERVTNLSQVIVRVRPH
jgi:hypothetical protein